MILRFLATVFLACGLAAQSPPPPVLSDAQIDAQLRERLAKSVVGKDGITARVKGGIVYWEGRTAIAQHKGAATRMAKSAGARRVVNNIRVIGAKVPAKPKVSSSSKPAAQVPAVSAPPVATSATAPIPRAAVRWVPTKH